MSLRTRLQAATLIVCLLPSTCLAGWSVGVGKSRITPTSPTWMAGYGARDRPSEGAVHDLWAKALVLQDDAGQRSLLVTLDVCGIARELSLRIRDRVKTRHNVPIERVVLSCSHTHCGPVLGRNLLTMYDLNADQAAKVVAYEKEFEAKVNAAIDDAFKTLVPARISWETGRADFAVNRRTNKEPDVPALRDKNALEGPVDHDVPVLTVRAADGPKVKAVVFGYACHCTVLSFYRFCGDYAGFAQIALEARYEGAQAMFVAGCGADQNPLPRRTQELAEQYGKDLADAVGLVVDRPGRAVDGSLAAAYQEIDLKFGTPPTREQIVADSASKTYAVASRARKLLATLDTTGKLPETYPYPIQSWRLGGLTWVFLGGEVVVDYSLRLKRNLGPSRTWVSAYCNDVMAYIPSARVLAEGGYEGATAMIYYGHPGPWSAGVEAQIFDALTTMLKASPAR